MVIKLKDVIAHYVGLNALATKKLPLKLSFSIAYNLEMLEKEVKRVDAQRAKLIDEYAKRDDQGQIIMSEQNGQKIYDLGSNKDTFVNEYEEFIESEIDIEIRTVSEDIIDKCDDPKYDALSMADASALLFMID